jgi:PAS domain S-box-containing protein
MIGMNRLLINLPAARTATPSTYLLAAAMVAAALLLRIWMADYFAGVQFITFFPVIILVTFVGGPAPGLFAAALALVLVWYFLIPPVYGFRIDRVADVCSLLMFAAVASLEVFIVSTMRTALTGVRVLNDTLATVFNGNPDGLVVVDRRGRIVQLNDQIVTLFGHARESLVDQPIEILIPERLRTAHASHFEAFASDPRRREMGVGTALFGRRTDGTEFPVDVQLAQLRLAGEALMIATVRDVTAEKAAAEVLIESRRQQAILEERERAAEQVRFLADAFDKAAFGVAIGDARTDTLRFGNPAFAAMCGRTAGEVAGMHIADFYPDEERPRVAAALATATRDGYVSYESRLLRKDGTTFPAQFHITSVRTSDGIVDFRIASVLDISERKRMEAETKALEERFRLLVAAVKDYAILMLDLEGNVITWNEGAQRIKCYHADEIVGRNFECFFPAGDVADGKPRAELRAAVERGSFEEEGWRVHKDGSRFIAQVLITPIFDEAGGRVGFVKVTRDISERKQAEQKLAAQARLMAQLMETAPAAIAVFDRSMRYLAASRRFRADYRVGDQALIGRSHYEIFPEVPDRWREIHRRCLAGATERCEEEPFPRHDGTVDWVRWEMTPWYDEDGAIGGLILLSEVITERKRTEQMLATQARDLRRSNAELEQFAYVAAHDLREPLRMVASYTELLGERYQGRLDDKADKYLHYAVDGARRMQRLIDDLLDYSRIAAQGKPLQPTQVAAVVGEVIETMRMTIEETAAEIVCGQLPIVHADPGQLAQLFQNLIGNALKFRSEHPPRIRIDARHGDSEWVLSVADNGIGIPAGDAERVFQMFQRLHGRSQYEGSGMGLAIVRKIVERHHGRIWLESGLGKGTTFHFTLPADRADGALRSVA